MEMVEMDRHVLLYERPNRAGIVCKSWNSEKNLKNTNLPIVKRVE